MGITLQWPSERAFVEWRLKDLQPVVDEMRHDFIIYLAAAIVSCVVAVAAILLNWGSVWFAFSLSQGFFSVRFYQTYRRWVDARLEFRYLCARRLALIVEEAHAAEVARYKEMARRLGGDRG